MNINKSKLKNWNKWKFIKKINLKGIEKLKKENNNENKFKIVKTINFKIIKNFLFGYSIRPLNIQFIVINFYFHHIFH